MDGVEENHNNIYKRNQSLSILKEVFILSFCALISDFSLKFFESISLLHCFIFHLQTLSFNPIYYSLGFCKEKFFKREFVVFWSLSDYCICDFTTSGLDECDWGVGYSLVVVILCGSSSGSEILLGESGDVELVARTSKQISVFAIGLLILFTCFPFILILSINTLTTRLHYAPQTLI